MKPRAGESIQHFLLRMQRRRAAVVVAGPALGLPLLLVRCEPSAVALSLFGVFYVLSMLGITVGFHRLLAHRAFAAPDGARAFLAALGCLAGEGTPTFWVATHRAHHRESDLPGDPHSPRAGAGSFFHAHIGWMFSSLPADPLRNAPDVLRDAAVMAVQRRYGRIQLAGLVTPALIGGALLGPWGLFDGFVWGGLLRMLAVQHVTWCINSVCHVLGTKPFATGDESRNNALLGLLALGEGWHNNHHASPSSAAQGLRWWQLDLSWWTIRALAAFGFASRVAAPDAALLARARGRAPAVGSTDISTAQGDGADGTEGSA